MYNIYKQTAMLNYLYSLSVYIKKMYSLGKKNEFMWTKQFIEFMHGLYMVLK